MDIQKRLQYCSDKLQPQFRYRWMATFVLACFYALRVYLYGYCILTFFLGMSISTLVMFLLSSRIDPDLLVSSDAPSILPTKASDELRPFVPFLPEFEFWCIVNKILCVALCVTFIPILNLPGIWYIYFIIWLFYTVQGLLEHREDMIKYKYIPFHYGNKELGVFLGGRAAEEVIYGRDTSKASVSYLADASWLARKIITVWNMKTPMVVHGEPSPWRKRVKFVGPRIDFEGSLYDDYDLIEPPVNFKMDDGIAKRTEELMCDMYRKTVDLLRQHNAALLKTVKVLLDRKEISGDEIDYILDNYPPQTPTRIVLEEKNPGSLPIFDQEQVQSDELEYSLLSS